MHRPNVNLRRRGNVLPMVVVLSVLLIGIASFAIDTGYIALNRTRMQRAADSGVLAGAESLANWEGRAVPETAARDELRKFVQFNESLDVRDEDIRLLRYDPTKASGSRVSYTYSVSQPPNAIELVLRRDAISNGRLPLFFAPVLGQNATDVRVKATAFMQPAKAVLPGVPMIPYAMDVVYYRASVELSKNGIHEKLIDLQDNWKVKPDGTVVSGSDGIKEIVLFGGDQKTPGNFGSIDLGSKSNGTPELKRQILYGPTWSDFHDLDFRDKLQRDGSLLPPFEVGGDPGLSTSIKESFDEIIGKPRIIPLYDTVDGNGANTVYHIIGFAAVVVTSSDLKGNPKRVWVQPTSIITNKIIPADLDTTLSEGVWTPPRLVMP